ncbi:hypothetical protein [Zobellia alginiliquefaciens]|uniref:hypothetical protein n=1 Tax=Zobellia alginiliquefaciens TaxID=3032586 RepID=UPI0023E36A09|nr:hypothetical protein [Zobellia alginiliquefaciens]
MRNHRLLLICVTLIVNVGISNGQNQKKFENGFIQLFNGENFDGWHLKLRNGDSAKAKEVYTIEDGMVHVFKCMPDSFGNIVLEFKEGELLLHNEVPITIT